MLFARLLLVAALVWLGGLVAIDFVETPARFRTSSLTRNQITQVGRSVFVAFGKYEMILASAVLALSLAHRFVSGTSTAPVVAGLLMASVLVQTIWLRPQLNFFAQQLDLIEPSVGLPTHPLRQRLRRHHRLYIALDLTKMLLCGALVILILAL